MCVKDRVKVFAEYKKMTISKFEEMCELSNGYIAAMRKGFGQEKLNNVLKAFPELNREWLLYGEGTMLKNEAVMSPADGTAAIISQNKVIAQAMEQGMVITDADNIDMSAIPVEVYEAVVEEVKKEESVVIVSAEVANSPDTNIRKYIKEKGDELERIYLGDLLPKGAKVVERVRKTSMLPSFQPGDWVFVKFINKDNITDGETYYFDFNTRPTMIRKVKIEGNNLRLIAKNPQFGDIIIKREEINNIGDIVGLFRNYFGDQYDDIEAMRRKKDAQIDKLLDQNSEALRIISNLIPKNN